MPDLPQESAEKLANQIAELGAHLQAATCRQLLLIAEFDQQDCAGDLNFRSTAHFLSFRTGDCLPTAREKVRVARKLPDLPRVVEAFSRGAVSYSKVRAITRVATADNEQVLVDYALHLSTSQLERVVRSHRTAGEQEQEQAQRQQQRRRLSYYVDDDDMVVIRGRLPPDIGAVLVKALQVAADGQSAEDAEEEHDLCDALAEVATAALDSGLAARQGKARPSAYRVLLKVDDRVLADPAAEGQCEVQGGVSVSPETARRISCDAPVSEVHEQGGGCCDHDGESGCALHMKRSRRRPGAALERAVRVRDGGVCQFPGCESRRYLQLHHVKHWAEGGETNLGNLLLLCSHCHRKVHEGGVRLEPGERGRWRFINPEGRQIANEPPRISLPFDPVQALRSHHERDLGLKITPQTGNPKGDPTLDPIDYHDAVGALVEAEEPPACQPEWLRS